MKLKQSNFITIKKAIVLPYCSLKTIKDQILLGSLSLFAKLENFQGIEFIKLNAQKYEKEIKAIFYNHDNELILAAYAGTDPYDGCELYLQKSQTEKLHKNQQKIFIDNFKKLMLRQTVYLNELAEMFFPQEDYNTFAAICDNILISGMCNLKKN